MTITQQRNSRYHCSGKQPPGLKAVFREFSKSVRGKGFFQEKKVAVDACARGFREYNNKNRANELVGFLRDAGVLISPSGGDDARLFYDADRAILLLSCCDARCEPGPAGNVDLRISAIKQKYDPETPAEPDAEVARPTLPSGGVTGVREVSSGLLKTEARHTHVLYLTPCEDDVWTALCTEAEETPSGAQVTVPWEAGDVRCAWAKKSLSCSETEYVCVVQRLVEAKILEKLGKTADERAIFRFTRHPLAYHVEKITERSVLAVPEPELEAIRTAQTEFTIPQGAYFNPALDAWAESRFGDKLNISAWRSKIVGYRPGDRYKGWGIFFRKGAHIGRPRLDEVETYMSIPGFDAYDFRPKEVLASGAGSVFPSPLPLVQEETGPEQLAEQADEPAASDSGTVSAVEPPPTTVSVAEPAIPPPAAVPKIAESVVSSVVPADIGLMDDTELARSLAEWHRMMEDLPIAINIAQAEKSRRREERSRSLSGELTQRQAERDAIEKEVAELERLLSEKRSQAEAKSAAIIQLQAELDSLET
ncbi:MAG: hypothetical protein WC551_00295 [Patescibacteria group bacterium]